MNMLNRFLLPAVLMSASTTFGDSDLFRSLDKNGDGRISQGEIKGPQTPFFKRALRVADRDKDGALTVEELEAALTDSKPTELVTATGPFTGRNRQASNFNIRLLDKNQDGLLTLDEAPEPLKPRLRQIMERTGQTSVPIESIERLAGTTALAPQTPARPATAQSRSPNNRKPVPQPNSTGSPADFMRSITPAAFELPARILQNFERVDQNQDGGIDREELANGLRMIQASKSP